MKARVFVAWTAAFAASAALSAQSSDGQHEVRIDLDHLPASEKAPPRPVPPTPARPTKAKPAPAAIASKPAPAAAAAAVADDAKPKIDGLELSRGPLGFLGVKVEDNTWKITFYDQDKKPKPVDVAAIVLRWPVQYQRNDERVELLPSADGKAMVSPKVVRPPFSFKLFMTLLKDTSPGADMNPEMYVIDFHQ